MISDEALMVYLDGQLEPGHAREIEAALAEDAALRARLARLEAVDRQVKAAFEPLLQPVPDALLERVRAARPEPAAPAGPDNVVALALAPPSRARKPEATAGDPPTAAPPASWPAIPPWVGWAAAAQIVLVIGAAALFQAQTPGPQYRTLGSASTAPAGNMLVIFRPETPERRLRETLKQIDASIVGGPTATDAYLLRVAPDQRASALTKLRGRADIVMAQPVDAGGPP